MIAESKRQGNKITQEYIAKFGQNLAPFDGVTQMFNRLRQSAHEINPKLESAPEEWGRELSITQGQRVANLAPVDYSENSELMQSLTLAVESLCKQISLQQLSVGE